MNFFLFGVLCGGLLTLGATVAIMWIIERYKERSGAAGQKDLSMDRVREKYRNYVEDMNDPLKLIDILQIHIDMAARTGGKVFGSRVEDWSSDRMREASVDAYEVAKGILRSKGFVVEDMSGGDPRNFWVSGWDKEVNR